MFYIDKYKFNDNAPNDISKLQHFKTDVGNNWPVVYIINNDAEAYVGETVSAARRVEQHLQNNERRTLSVVRIISDETFNKSVILDLESFLIRYMGADGKFSLQNGNGGIQNHEYYDKSIYQDEFEKIWKKLKHEGIVEKSIDAIENSELFKYSPYKALGKEQIDAERLIVKALADHKDDPNGTTIVVRGGAGTGKTILAIYLIKFFMDLNEYLNNPAHEEDELLEAYQEWPEAVMMAESIEGIRKVGIVIPQASLKTSVKTVFKKVKFLDPSMVVSPAEVVNNYLKTGVKYDLLLVDEAHRLKCRYHGHLSQYGTFDGCCKKLGMDKDTASELDWILHCSNNQILFRDENQTVRPCDLNADDFLRITSAKHSTYIETSLTSQWRCLGGNDYILYLRNIFDSNQQSMLNIPSYDVRLYDDCEQMINDIKALDKTLGLCRVAAGFAWPWEAKNEKKRGCIINDVKIQGHEYHWNSTTENWITTANAINEIGCIHTLQGYDLNYAGIIIGEDLKYNLENNEIYADKDCYFDQQGKSGVANDPEALLNYLKNIYMTLLTRGIRGTYIYVCNDELRKYLKQFFLVI